MENKDDLLNLDKDKNPKKILVYGAGAFLVFVIGVIVFALVGGNEKKQTDVIPPQVKEEPIFKEIPIEKETKSTQAIKAVKEEAKKEEKTEILPKKEKESKTEQKTNEVKEVKKEVKEKPQKKEIIKEPIKTKTTTHKPNKKVEGNYYIQVAALMKYSKPNKKFLDLIKKYGYSYTLYPVEIKRDGKIIKINKLLIGPFASRKEAEKNLVKVKKYITQNAFIFKVK